MCKKVILGVELTADYRGRGRGGSREDMADKDDAISEQGGSRGIGEKWLVLGRIEDRANRILDRLNVGCANRENKYPRFSPHSRQYHTRAYLLGCVHHRMEQIILWEDENLQMCPVCRLIPSKSPCLPTALLFF